MRDKLTRGHIVAGPFDGSLTEGNSVVLHRNGAFGIVEKLVFDKNHGVVISQGGFEEPLGVVGIGGQGHLQAGDVGEHGLQALGMLGGVPTAATLLGTDDQRHFDAAARHVSHLGSLVEDLIACHPGEVHEHQLGHGALTRHGQAHSSPHKTCFRDGGFDDTVRAVLFQQSLGDFEDTAVDADVFPEQEDVGVALHFFIEGLAQGLGIRDFAHEKVILRRTMVKGQFGSCTL